VKASCKVVVDLECPKGTYQVIEDGKEKDGSKKKGPRKVSTTATLNGEGRLKISLLKRRRGLDTRGARRGKRWKGG